MAVEIQIMDSDAMNQSIAENYSTPIVSITPQHSLSHYGYTVLACIFLWVVVSFATDAWARRGSNIKYIGFDGLKSLLIIPRWQMDAYGLMREGIKKYGLTKPFKVWTMDGDFILLPKSAIPEIMEMPPEKLNFRPEANLMMAAKYTGAKVDKQWQADSFRINMTRALGPLMPLLEEETIHSIASNIHVGEDWTPVHAYPVFLRMVAQIAGRIFVGAPMNRDPEWLDVTTNYTGDVLKACYKMKICPPFFRPILGRVLPEILSINRTYKWVKGIVIPILKDRLAKEEEAKAGVPYDKPNDLMQWLLDQQRQHEALDLNYQAITLLLATLASQHTTTMAVTQAMFDLATHPEFIAPLREEVNDVWNQHQGLPSKQSLLLLRKLDSFMKESQRHNPPFAVSMGRNVIQPVTLKDGTYLHQGAHLAVPTMALDTLDPVMEKPDEFLPFRYYQIWEKSRDEFHHQFTNTATSGSFGAGRNTCPGRFLASAEIKLILAYLIKEYDFKLPNPEAGRPQNLKFEQSMFPNVDGRVLLKRI